MEHGLSKTRLYSIYSGMKQRCYNPNNQHYQWYGAKGITICDEWMGENGLQNFIEWSLNHGYEEHLTIDRKENDKVYSPDNCQWVTASLNSSRANIAPLDESHIMGNSQKIRMALAYKGMSESELAKALGKTPQAFNQRMKTDKFSTEDLSKIAEVMGASYISQFSFPDGTKI